MPASAAPPDPELIKSQVQACVRYLSIRPRSTREVEIYLSRRTGSDQALFDAVMAKIQLFKLLNDEQFAHDWVLARLHRYHGPIFIHQELKLKGVEPNLIETALNSIDKKTWLEAAREYARQKRLLSMPLDSKAKQRLYQSLYRRGFTSSTITQLIDSGV